MLTLLLALTVEARADCAADLTQALNALEGAFHADDPAADGSASAEALAAVGAVDRAFDCLDAPVAPRTAARIHRAHALGAWLAGDDPGEHLVAMRRADPWLSWDLAGPEHPLTLALHRAEEAALPPIRALPSSGDWRVDGLDAPVVPTRLPVLVQLVENGRVADRFAGRGAKVPSRSGGGRAPWLVGGAASSLVAAGLYGGAWAANASYHHAVEAGDDARTLRMHGATNGLTVGSLGAAGAAAALLAVGFSRQAGPTKQ